MRVLERHVRSVIVTHEGSSSRARAIVPRHRDPIGDDSDGSRMRRVRIGRRSAFLPLSQSVSEIRIVAVDRDARAVQLHRARMDPEIEIDVNDRRIDIDPVDPFERHVDVVNVDAEPSRRDPPRGDDEPAFLAGAGQLRSNDGSDREERDACERTRSCNCTSGSPRNPHPRSMLTLTASFRTTRVK